MIKTGAQHTESLKDDRAVYIDGQVVNDVTVSPYYRNAVASVGRMFDFEFKPITYACRPPGVWHGPFRSETGCLLLEMHYYDPA